MKLFHHDDKHDRINGELDLGDISFKEQQLLKQVIAFLAQQGVTNRRQNVTLAKTYSVHCDGIEFITD